MDTQAIQIDFSYKLFNPSYWHIIDAFNDPNIRYIFLRGGSSAAKTYGLAQAVMNDNLENGNGTLILRKFSTDITDSVYTDFKTVAGVSEDVKEMYDFQIHKIINRNDGSYMRFRGLDDSEKVKGASQFKRMWLEELSQFEYEDFKQVRKRLRGMPGQQVVATWNPISDQHWLKLELEDQDEWTEVTERPKCAPKEADTKITSKKINKAGDTILIHLTYKDNYWVMGSPDGKYGFRDQHVIDDFEKDKERDYYYYQVYALGEYGNIKTGGEYYHNFNRGAHTSEVKFLPTLPSHLCFDFNVWPYMTLCCYQLLQKSDNLLQIRGYKEYCLEHPFNTTKEVCKAWIAEYGEESSGLFFYGDSSGKNRIPGFGDLSNYVVVEEELIAYLNNDSDRVLRRNPNPLRRRDLVLKILAGEMAIEFILDEGMKNTVNDFENVKLGPNGKDKKKFNDKKLGISYELHGHPTDATEGLISWLLNDLL